MDSILDDPSGIIGVIYVIEHTATSKKYVGQTLSHRKNREKYRPFGAIGRFRDHLSEALNNTKLKQCTYLNNAIRLYGAEAFTVAVIETCDRADLDTREIFHIENLCTLYPAGYNLTCGGKCGRTAVTVTNEAALKPPKKHGGCQYRSVETRQRMSDRIKERGFSVAERSTRMANAQGQHNGQKLERFKGLVIDPDHVDDYIRVRKNSVIVTVGDCKARFVGKYEYTETLVDRAKEFLSSLWATPPNCSGNP